MEDVDLAPAVVTKLKQKVENGLLQKGRKHGRNQEHKPKTSTAPSTKSSHKNLSKAQALGANGALQKNGSTSKPAKQATDQKTHKPISSVKNKATKRNDARLEAHTSKKTKRMSLREEVLALGGDDEDLKMIEAIESDSEFEERPLESLDQDLQKDLAKFMKSMPFTEVEAEFSSGLEDENDLEEDDSDEADDEDTKAPNPSSQDFAINGLLIEPRSEWFDTTLTELGDLVPRRISDRAIQALLSYGRDLLKEENQAYAKSTATSSSHKYYKDMMISGTLTDKVSALTLSVQESPIHNQHALEQLLAMAKKRNRNQAVQVLRALKDLFGAGTLLPSDRRLRYFSSQPGLSSLSPKSFDNWNRNQPLPEPLSKEHLLLWAYEDWLKSSYFEVIKVLETWSNDEITYARLKSVDYIFDLLKEKPEQEANLLNLLVNKLGDPDKQVASRVSAHLVQLQIPHPFMKSVIISAVEADILFKPGATWHGKYYAIITLNQTILNSDQQDVVKRLLDIYFSLFVSLLNEQPTEETPKVGSKLPKSNAKSDGTTAQHNIKTRGKAIAGDTELKEKITSGILTGINRAFPYTASNDDFFEKHLDTLYKITHASNFNTSIQALMLLQQLTAAYPSASDRFYRTLYESLLDARLLTTSKHALYINLLYRSMKADTSIKRVQAFVKRLGQIITMHQPSFVCAVIYLIKDLEDTFPGLRSLIDQPEAFDGEEEGIMTTATIYDGKKRDPQFSNADRCCLWEVQTLANHFHPSVSLFVSKLLAKQNMETKPDLSMHTLMNFLDRFVYRNPKKVTDALKGVSLMQPMATMHTSDMLVSGRANGKRKAPALNTIDFARMNGDKVQADEVFFHKYFATRDQGKELAQRRKDKKQAGGEEEDEEAEEDIWKALVDSRPELGDAEEEFDEDADDFSDLEAAEYTDDDQDDDQEDEEGGIDLDDSGSDAFMDSDEEVNVLSDDEDERQPTRKAVETTDTRSRKKRKLLRDLPTFASAEDYAEALQNEEDGL